MSKMGEVRVRLSIDGKLLGRRGQADRIATMLAAGTLRRLRVTFVPRIAGGAGAPTLTGDPRRAVLGKSIGLRLESMMIKGDCCEADYLVPGAKVLASADSAKGVGRKVWKRATRKMHSSAT
jgi:riboflavin biosynthesis pyrimidine reductase